MPMKPPMVLKALASEDKLPELDTDVLRGLIELLPTSEEVSTLTGYSGPPEELPQSERFLIDLLKVLLHSFTDLCTFNICL